MTSAGIFQDGREDRSEWSRPRGRPLSVDLVNAKLLGECRQILFPKFEPVVLLQWN